jgi:protein-S-isoprenylcysteine O-methyltransferase Ste14
MEQISYYVSIAAFATVIACWFIFAGAFLLRKKPPQAKDAVNAPKSWLGIGLQGVSYGLVWALHRTPMFSPFVDDNYVLNIVLQVLAATFSISSVFLTMSAIRELGKQWSLEARLVEGHKLVTTGVYSWVRHPIYTAMLSKLIATAIVISHWAVALIAVAIFLVGTFIRTRFEERLLGEAFGAEFAEWKSRVPGLVPFLIL